MSACAVCGMGGYWVGFDPQTGEDRCVNHIGDHWDEPEHDAPDQEFRTQGRAE